MKKEQRIRKKKDFEMIQKEGEKFFARLFILNYKKSNLKKNRIGVIVSTKVSKRAVKRNVLRRRIQESLRHRLPELKSGYDIIVIASKNMVTDNKPLPYQVIDEELERALKNAKLLK